MRVRPIVKGLLTFVPLLNQYAMSGTGGTVSARYCYSVWLRHMVRSWQSGLDFRPKVVAELGPGDSLGTGLAALLSGVERYYAFDAKTYAHSDTNLQVLKELVGLFRNREPIPGPNEMPLLEPTLDSYAFPHDLLSDERLDAALAPERIERILHAVENDSSHDAGAMIRYFAPWYEAQNIEESSVDAVISQAAMEHVSDLEFTYASLMRWLRPGGWMSHQIDFKCHKTADEWNGHWAYSDFLWSVIQGKRSYLLNREPHSRHIEILERNGFRIDKDEVVHQSSTLRREQLAARFRAMTDDDLSIPSAFVQATKPMIDADRGNVETRA